MAIETYEQALVFAARNGNETSFEELYKMYYQKVYALIRMTIKDAAEAEDVLQQTFVNAWNNISKLEDINAFNTWIQRIAVNQCYSVMRRHKELLTTDSEEQQSVLDELESEFMLPEVYATQNDLGDRLKQIISELSAVQKQTILLYYYEEMSVEEIAQVMECSPGTVKSRLYLARKAIGTEIEEQERKSGQKFFGVAGAPLTAFSKIFAKQVSLGNMAEPKAMELLHVITRKLGFAKNPIRMVQENPGAKASSVSQGNAPQPQQIPHQAKGPVNELRQAVKMGSEAGKAAAQKAVSTSTGNALGLKVAAIITGATLVVGGGTAGGIAIVKNAIGNRNGASNAPAMEAPQNAIVEEVEDPDARATYEAYLRILEEEEEPIRNYDWLKYYDEESDDVRSIGFWDVTGDDVPEMFYVESQDGIQSDLHVVTAKDGEPVEILKQDWDYAVGGGMRYAVWAAKGERAFYSIEMDVDEGSHTSFVKYEVGKKDLSVTREVLCTCDRFPNSDGSVEVEYTVGGKTASEEKYNKQVQKAAEKAYAIFLETPGRFDDKPTAQSMVMTYPEAVNWLRAMLGMEPLAIMQTVDPETLPQEARDFILRFYCWYWADNTKEFDCEHATEPTRNILANIVQNAPCVDLQLYPGTGEEDHWGEEDPRGWWADDWPSYAVFDGQQADWVAEHIFHVPQDEVTTLWQQAEEAGLLYRDGAAEGDYYYYTRIGGIGDPFISIGIDAVQTDGKKYYVTYSSYFDSGSNEERDYNATYYTVIAPEMIDGTEYWTMYLHTKDVPEPEAEDAPELFSMIQGDYVFTSGAGGWGTTLEINSDGTFTCEYSDTDFAWEEEYDYIIYHSECHGRFGNPRKINEYTYAFDLLDMVHEGEIGDSKDDTINGQTQRAVFTECYGMEPCSTVYVYTEDAPVDRLPETFLSWVWMARDTSSDKLGITALYNQDAETGFMPSQW